MNPTPRPRASGAFLLLVSASLAWAQSASPATETTTPSPRAPIPVTSAPAAAKPAGETIVLTPFEVAGDTKGYYASNTMSGTRFNSKLEDLASSISVMTKEQMSDFAMLDINDVFLYTNGAEGSGTYTDYVMDRNGQLTDNVQGSPTTANRLRGISSANVSYGNYETQSRMPIDPLIVEGVEVSRGPNANVFGLGNSSGTVNQVPVSANLTRNISRADFRADSYDGWRTSLDLNRVLIRNKLAIRINGGLQHEGFVRKPSGVDAERYNALIKYQPFRNTRISAGYLHYRMTGNRPNFTPPRDYVSDWLAAGRPGWDPILQVVHVGNQTIGNGGPGTTTPITADANVPAYFTRAGTIQSRSNVYVDQNGISYWSAPSSTNPASVPLTPAANGQTIRLMQSGVNLGTAGAALGRYTNQPLFTTTPSVSGKSIYDWSDVNLSSVNRLIDKTDTYNVELDQLFFNTPRQMLAAQLGFFREDSERYQRTPIGNSGTSGQSGQLFVDVNERNIDGTVNPFFGRPYIGVTEPIVRYLPAKWDTYRAQLAYKLDLRQESGWLKWLGVQQLSGYNEYKYRINRAYAYRDALTSDHSWTAPGPTGFAANTARGVQSNVTGGPQAGANIVRQYYRYYVGDANGGNVDYAPSTFKYGAYPFNWGGYTIGGGVPVAGSGRFVSEPATLAQVATTDSTGGNNNLKQIIKTSGAVLQSHFLEGALVTTFGLREDKVYSKNGLNPVLLSGNEHNFTNNNHWAAGDYRFNSGKTKTGGAVLRPFRDLAFVNRKAEQSTGVTRFLAEAARGLTLTYNQSDNFIPQAPAVDLFLKPLPNITGKGKDYGFWLNLPGSFVLRLNRWTTNQLNARDGDANTVAQRVLRLDLDISADAYQLYDRADGWFRALNPGWTDGQVRQAVADQTKIPIPLYDSLLANFRAGTIAATNDVTAKGTEVELTFNPTKYWTLTGSANETQSISRNVSSAVQQWIDQRLPVWTSIVDPNTDPAVGIGQSQGWTADAANPSHLWWIHNYGGSQTASQNYATFVDAPYRVIKQQEGKSKPSIRKYAFKLSTSYQLAGITDNKILKGFKIGGAVRWEDKGAIGYYGKNYAALIATNQPITELDPHNPVWDKAHWYFDAFLSYRTRLWKNRIGTTFQLNVRNLQEDGRLQAIGAFPDGKPNAYRIVDPRQFILSASFDL
ncbi:MAG: TonB-dependent receptor [Undibacterium sp.]|nr:TonB-dependent receptor [Opitutaceae bacterium]